jgi:hypothetical protein
LWVIPDKKGGQKIPKTGRFTGNFITANRKSVILPMDSMDFFGKNGN